MDNIENQKENIRKAVRELIEDHGFNSDTYDYKLKIKVIDNEDGGKTFIITLFIDDELFEEKVKCSTDELEYNMVNVGYEFINLFYQTKRMRRQGYPKIIKTI